ncbi:MAG: hypothetical protein AAGA72_01145 [Pseudomonadota bacterium]
MRPPSNYEDWKHCITVECGIALTPEYIEGRIQALNDAQDLHTKKFIDQWGRDHLNRVISWFETARVDV